MAVSLVIEEVLVIHALLLERFGGMDGVTEQGFGKLEAAVAAPDVSMFGEELYPDLPSKASELFYRLARAHAFTDGNKRVALVALLDYLERHGTQLHASDDELYEFVMRMAGDGSREHAAGWIGAHIGAG